MSSVITSTTIGFCILLAALSIFGRWMMFKKAGKPGWHSLIPFLNVYDEFSLCWKGSYGILFLIGVAAVNLLGAYVKQSTVAFAITLMAVIIILFIMHIKQCILLSRSFGYGTIYGLFLIFFNGLAKVILGLGDAEYVGKPCEV